MPTRKEAIFEKNIHLMEHPQGTFAKFLNLILTTRFQVKTAR